MEQLIANLATVDLELPSDHLISDLRDENDRLRDRIKLLEQNNTCLQTRLFETIRDWKALDNKLRMNEISDILSDFQAEWYHNELLRYLRTKAKENGDSFVPDSWTSVSNKLTDEARVNKNDLKSRCMEFGTFTEEEFDYLYEFKRNRNSRVHPKRNRSTIQKIMRDLPSGILKTAFNKMLNTTKTK